MRTFLKVKFLRGMVRKSYVYIAKNLHGTSISVVHRTFGFVLSHRNQVMPKISMTLNFLHTA